MDHDDEVLIFLLTCAVIGGVGMGTANTSGLRMIESPSCVGMVEQYSIARGVGILLGPIVGAILYSIN